MAKNLVTIDGTTLEGGGQLLRVAVCLSALTKTPISITNIRGNRRGGGGLKLQHLKAVEWLAEACNATVEGGQVGSKSMIFTPSPQLLEPRKLRSEIDIGTPGSITLVLQAVLPYLLFSAHAFRPAGCPFTLTIRGGTNVGQSPSYDYIVHVLLPTLERHTGLPPVKATLEKRGWNTGRASIGSARFSITPLPPGHSLAPFEMGERGEIKTILAKIIAPPACRRAIIDETRQRLSNVLGRDIEVEFEYEDSRDAKRLYLLLIAVSANDCRLGRGWLFDEKFRNPMDASGRLVKRVVGELVGELEHGGCVDEFMRDQIVVFQALAEGRCEIDVGRGEDGTHMLPSLHTKTAEWVAGQVLGIVVREDGLEEGSAYVVPGIEDDIKDDDDVQKLAEGV